MGVLAFKRLWFFSVKCQSTPYWLRFYTVYSMRKSKIDHCASIAFIQRYQIPSLFANKYRKLKREEQARWKANIEDLSTGAESHMEDGARVPGRTARKWHIHAAWKRWVWKRKEGMWRMERMVNIARGYFNATPQCWSVVLGEWNGRELD